MAGNMNVGSAVLSLLYLALVFFSSLYNWMKTVCARVWDAMFPYEFLETVDGMGVYKVRVPALGAYPSRSVLYVTTKSPETWARTFRDRDTTIDMHHASNKILCATIDGEDVTDTLRLYSYYLARPPSQRIEKDLQCTLGLIFRDHRTSKGADMGGTLYLIDNDLEETQMQDFSMDVYEAVRGLKDKDV